MERVNSLIRMVMVLAGSFLIGGGIKFFGKDIDASFWDELIGVVLTLTSLYWSIKTREVNIEKTQTSLIKVFTFVGGFLLAKGYLTQQAYEGIAGFITAITAYIYSGTSRQKSDQIQQGIIQPHQLKTTAKK